jgi:hypothetical protein
MPTPVPFDAMPHDRTAEAALLACCMTSARAMQQVRHRVKATDFFLLSHRHIYTACTRLADAGQPADLITVQDDLERHGTMEEVGGLDTLHDIALSVESAANVDHYATIVIRDSDLRGYIRLGEQVITAAQSPNADPEDLSARLLMSYENRQKRSAAQLGLPWKLPQDIFAPVPPVPWLIPGLHLAPGRPCIVAGYGASAKTLSCQAMAIAAAAGVPVWGNFHTPHPLRVRHIDAEQGEGATRRRYKRLAYAMGLVEEALEDRLQMISFPGIYLSGKGAEGAWKRVADGADLVIIDSLRAMTPGTDENSSEMRRHLDPLTRISESTGCAFVLVHHAGKSPAEPGSRREARQQLRGSSGIFDAAGGVFLLTGAGNAPKKVEQTKAPADAEGGSMEPFWLVVEDVSDGCGNDRAGVRLVHHAEDPGSGADAPTAKLDAIKLKITAVVQERPGLSSRLIAEAVGGRSAVVYETLNEMVDEKAILREFRQGKGGANAHFIL